MIRRFDIGKGTFRPDVLGLSRITRDLYSADSPEITAAAKVLRKHVGKQLAIKGGGRLVYRLATKRPAVLGATRSRPGEAPRRQTGRLMRSVIQGKVDTGRRIGVMWFTGPIFEVGVDTALPKRTESRKRRKTTVRKTTNLRQRLVIRPRPFMLAGIKSAEPEMVGVAAKLGGDHLEQAANQIISGSLRT